MASPGPGRLGLAVLVARERIDATAEDSGGLALIKREFLAHAGDEVWIDNRRVDLLREGAHLAHDAIRFRRIQDGLGAGRAEVSRQRRYDSGFTLVGVGQVASA